MFCWGAYDRVSAGHEIATRLELDAPARFIACGYDRDCAIRESGDGDCWGEWIPDSLEPIRGPMRSVAVSYRPCFVDEHGALLCHLDINWRSGTFARTELVAHGTSDVSAGEQFACAVVGAQVLCLGENHDGELGREPSGVVDWGAPGVVEELAEVVDVATGRRHACALRQSGDVYCWGNNERRQLGTSSPSTSTPQRVEGLPLDVVSIDAFHNNSCALRAGGELICWGDNDFEQLTRDRHDSPLGPTRIELDVRLVEVGVGGNFICGLDDASQVWCWGRNHVGQLGADTRTTRGVPSRVLRP
ncbi:MAG: hypothetical protein KC619_16160 [Myxococcales bacterium]|nr:hypothetical protein [Myxococcales bacterium]